jgi:type VI secretion system protein VasI
MSNKRLLPIHGMYPTRMAGIAVTLLATASAHSDERLIKDAVRCTAIRGDLERLQCFDDWTRARGLSGQQAEPVPAEGIGTWQVTRRNNPIDDTETVSMVVESTLGHSAFGKKPVLGIQCKSGQTQLVVIWYDYIAADRPDVVTRIGPGRAEKVSWYKSNTNNATILPSTTFASFVRRMLDAATMVAQVTPYSEPTITATFEITGLREAIKPLAEVCKLKLQ